MTPKSYAFSFFVLSVVLFLWLPSVGSSFTRRSLESGTLTMEETEKDFLNWVSMIGAKIPSTSQDPNFEASKVTAKVITVDKSGKGQFTSVQAAVNSVPTHNAQRIVIQIAAGVYEEQVFVPKNKPFVTFQGAGNGVTTITWHATASSTGSTQDSATVGVNSDYFIAKDISFKNSASAPSGGASGRQAVAFKIAGDKAAFYNCNFLGAQDTLFDDHGRHYFESCFIQGSIDFICGDGLSLYKGCQLHALPVPGGSYGSLTAQKGASPGAGTGFSFVNCQVTGSGVVYLGRAWGPYSRVVFSYTSMDAIVLPSGWSNWGISSREKTAFYGEYMCTGPGAKQNGRVAWSHQLTAAQAAPFQSISFIDGASWLQS